MGKLKHGLSKTTEYYAWNSMIGRCYNPKDASYSRYGGRGILVSDRWKDFLLFLADMGKRPSPEVTLERRDNNRGYSIENCYWATRKQQGRNRRSNRAMTLNQETLTVTEWAERYSINRWTVYSRLSNGIPLLLALTSPLQGYARLGRNFRTKFMPVRR